MPPKSKHKAAARKRARREEQGSDIEDELPPEKPPRPFKEIDGLPLSADPPEYNILSNALSIKDSAVLYSSLMKSRKAYTESNVFDLYWAKGKTKFDSDVSARDRMNKLCDCGMEIGPHTFDVRFFILKDDEVERKREEIKQKKKEKRLAKKKAREEHLKQREQQKLESGAASGSASGATPATGAEAKPSGAVSTETKPEEKTGENDNASDDSDSDDDDDDDDNDKKEQSADVSMPDASSAPPEEEKQEQKTPTEGAAVTEEPKEPTSQEESKESTPQEEPKELTPQEEPKESTPQPVEAPAEPKEEESKEPVDTKDSEQTKESASPAPETKDTKTDPAPAKKPPLPPLRNTGTPKSQSPQQQQQPRPQQGANDMMQSREAKIMVANLNAIASIDPKLNPLMKIVASGSATSAQIKEFQGYIQRAKAMGPTPFFKQQFPQQQQPKPAKPPKPPKKAKPPREKLLTTFQEMYVDGADLVFEFSDNPNLRFVLPKECIVEKRDKGEYVVSWLVIYNIEKIRKWRQRQQAKKEKLEKQKEIDEKKAELEKKKAEEDEKKRLETEARRVKEEEEEAARALEKRSSRTRRTSRKLEEEIVVKEEGPSPQELAKIEEEKKKKEEEKKKKLAEEDLEPIPIYSPLSFKITGVEEKYDPIFLNSFQKHDEVYAHMEKVMKEGIRAAQNFLWYQVDAFDDEALAENLREQLYLIENPPKKYKRRNADENPLTAKPKKAKKEKPVKTEAVQS